MAPATKRMAEQTKLEPYASGHKGSQPPRNRRVATQQTVTMLAYSAMKFAAFFMAEYANMVTVCCVATLLFLGGWLPLWPEAYGSNFVCSAILFVAGAICVYHGLHPARPFDRYTLPF